MPPRSPTTPAPDPSATVRADPADIGLGTVLKALGEPLYDDPGYCQRHAGSETEGRCVHLGGFRTAQRVTQLGHADSERLGYPLHLELE